MLQSTIQQLQAMDPVFLSTQAFIFVTGLFAQYFTIKKHVSGFYLFFAMNIACIFSTLHFGQYGMLLLFGSSIAFNIYGIKEWTNSKKNITKSALIPESYYDERSYHAKQ